MNLISFNDYKTKKLINDVDQKIKESDEEFDFVDKELIDDLIQEEDITLSNAVQTIWFLSERMDKLEVEIIKLKLIILEARYNDNLTTEVKI
jgi:polyhydroxyalkanoate synthesis regulator phasin